uniref:Putative secreted protein n=1 Tax=Amblyomma triste TaxID=251400 RepID=A0A023GBR1_AMBTT
MKTLHVILVLSLVTSSMASIWKHKGCLAFCRPNKPQKNPCKDGCVCHGFRFVPEFIGACLNPNITIPWYIRPQVSTKAE